jgi:Electron transfer DM13
MKHLIFSLFTLLSLMSCVKDIELIPIDDSLNVTVKEGVQEAQGVFANEVHSVSGTVKVISDSKKTQKKYLSFENFKTEQGPDLYIYLAEDIRSNNFVSVAKLANTGSFVLELPKNIELEKHQYVLVWCKQFSVLFGSAKLMK